MTRIRRARDEGIAAVATVLVLACGSDGPTGHTGSPTANTGSIELAMNPVLLSVQQGRSGSLAVTLTRSGGFSGVVSLAITGLPAGVTATITPAHLSGSTACATIDVAVAAAVAQGPYSATITATAIGVAQVRATYEVTVAAAPDPLPTAAIAFVSTRDGGGPAAGLGSVPYIYIADSDGSGVTRLTHGEQPAWSPDGRQIALARSNMNCPGGRGDLRVINADGTGERVLVSGGFSPAWSPDGKRIVYHTYPEGGIFAINLDGSNSTLLISHEFASPGFSSDYCVCWPTWAPDGQRIAFVRTNYEEVSKVYFWHLDGSPPRLLNIGGWSVWGRPSWSPDGSRILLQVSAFGIASVDTSGADLRIHVSGNSYSDADWSPDGRSFVFEQFTGPPGSVSGLGSRMRIFVSDLASGTVRQLIPDAVNPVLADYWDSEPVWSRVGR